MRRKPKQLTDEPSLFQPAKAGGGGLVLQSRGKDGRRGPVPPGATAPGETDEAAELLELADLAEVSEADQATRRLAQQIAQRLALARPVRDVHARRGIGELASSRWRGASDDIDLDRTLEGIAGVPYPEDSDIIVREWVRPRRSVVLVVDVSGSMKGERVRTAAATVGALAAELSHDDLAVVAFWSDAAVLMPLGNPLTPLSVLDLLLRVPSRGLTNVGFALEVARRQLAGVEPRDARVLLLSDCVHNAGPDPRPIAAGLPRLDVLLDTSAENDVELGRDLARMGRGRYRVVRTYRDVAPALTAIFDS